MTISRAGFGAFSGAILGGATGAAVSKENRLKGALKGAVVGGGTGALTGKLFPRRPPSTTPPIPHIPDDTPNWLRWHMEKTTPDKASHLYGRWKSEGSSAKPKIASLSLEAFSDELTKIALFQSARRGFVNALKEGWHGSPEQIAAGDGATWFGKGRQVKPGMGRLGRMAEEFTSLGGATRALPIGAKSMMALGTGLMAREALRPVDATGQNRSRTERLTGLAANTVGGLVGSAFGNRISPGLIGSIGGGLLGAHIAEREVTSPFAALRQRRAASQNPQNQYNTQPMSQEGV